MTTTEAPAAYHGRGYRPRQDDHATEVERGELCQPVGTDSEWAPLRHVLLSLPDPGWPDPDDWNRIQFLAPTDLGALADELRAYAQTLAALGITVTVAEPRPHRTRYLYNTCFARDQFFCVPEGAVVARMGSEARAGEELSVARALVGLGAPILRTISGTATFEGADALWLRPDHLLVGVGNRTNEAAVRQLRDVLGDQRVTVTSVPMPSRVQHLLGLMQIVGPHDVVVRSRFAHPDLLSALHDAGLTVHGWPEHDEVSHGQGMNFVVVDERRVVVLADRPWVCERLAGIGVEVAATVRATELLKAAGGLACATGIVRRDHTRDRLAGPSHRDRLAGPSQPGEDGRHGASEQ